MNVILGGLPEEIDGIPISADFRNMMQLDILIHDPDYSESERLIIGLQLLYPGLTGDLDENGAPYPAPTDIEKAVENLQWFYTRGNENDGKGGKPARAYDFDQDADIIFSDFSAVHHINLATVDFLHWWEFFALLSALPPNAMMSKIMYWRTADVGKLPKEEKKRVLEMRQHYAIKQTELAPLTPDELEQRTRDRIKKRFEEVGKGQR